MVLTGNVKANFASLPPDRRFATISVDHNMEQGFTFKNNYSGNSLYRRKPSVNEKYCIEGKIIILICLKGSARFNMRLKEYVLQENSFLTIGPGVPFFFTEVSTDFLVDIITLKESVYDKIAQGMVKIYFYKILYENPLQEMPEEKMKMCHNIHAYLKNFVDEEENLFRNQIIRNYINILFYEACNLMLHKPDWKQIVDNRKEEISGQFIFLVEKHFRLHRKVEFYAKELNITSKYLSATIKETTGRTPSAWIDDYTLTEARNLLRNSATTIQSISYDLGFATPSHFTKFIKEKTGMTPKDIRNNFDYGL